MMILMMTKVMMITRVMVMITLPNRSKISEHT